MRRLLACHFAPLRPDRNAAWPRLAAVLERSARQWCEGWDIGVRELQTPAPRPGVRAESYLANTYKLEAWHTAVEGAEDGDELVLLDADMMVTGPIDTIWDQAFDVAYTERPGCKVPLNAGVVFVRVSPASRRFLALWVEENAALLVSQAEFARWRPRYMGINQCALGKLLETRAGDHEARVLAVPCARWNCENENWATFDEATTRLVHIKDNIRLAVLRQGPTPPGCEPIVARWRALDAETRSAA